MCADEVRGIGLGILGGGDVVRRSEECEGRGCEGMTLLVGVRFDVLVGEGVSGSDVLP